MRQKVAGCISWFGFSDSCLFVSIRGCLRFRASVAGPDDRSKNGNENDCSDGDERKIGGDVKTSFHQQHFCADENEDDREPDVEKPKKLNRSSQHKIKRAQAEDGKDVGSENDEWIERDRKNRRDRIEGENQIRRLDHEQDQRHRGERAPPIENRHKAVPIKLRRDRKYFLREANRHVSFGMDLFLAAEEH